MNATIPPLGMSTEEFRKEGKKLIDFIADYYEQVGDMVVRSCENPGYLKSRLPDRAPKTPDSWACIMNDVREHIMPGITHWQSPRFHAYFPGSSSFPGQLGEMLSACFNVIGFSWINSPACTELEMIVMDWLVRLLGLPEHFLFANGGGGVIQGTAGEATFVSVVAARDKRLRQGISSDKLVAYLCDQSHMGYMKALRMANILEKNIRMIESDDDGDFQHQMHPERLSAAMNADVKAGRIPFYVGSTTGTTSTCAFDRLDLIGAIAKKFGAWFNVDAAYAGTALVCPEFREMIQGIEFADSFLFNGHKWMMVNFDMCAFFVRDPSMLEQSLSTDAAIYRNKASDSREVVDYRNWQVPLGRRFRALKLWFVLRMFGVEGLQVHVKRHCDFAKHFESLVLGDKRFEITTPTRLGLVCFRSIPDICDNEADLNSFNLRIIDELNDSGDIFIVNSVVHGKVVLRFVVCSPLTTIEHIERAWAEIARVVTRIIEQLV